MIAAYLGPRMPIVLHTGNPKTNTTGKGQDSLSTLNARKQECSATEVNKLHVFVNIRYHPSERQTVILVGIPTSIRFCKKKWNTLRNLLF